MLMYTASRGERDMKRKIECVDIPYCAVISVDPTYVVDRTGKVYGPRGPLTQYRTCGGKYRAVYLSGIGMKYVHRVVAEAFIPNPEGKPQVGHWDGDSLNNDVSNLRWVTQSENEADKVRHGKSNRGDQRSGSSKLSAQDVWEIRDLRYQGVSAAELAERFEVSKWTIYDACNPKRCWKHL